MKKARSTSERDTTEPSSTSTRVKTANTTKSSLTEFFEHWPNTCYVATGGLVLIFVSVVVLVLLFRYCKRKKLGSKPNNCTVDVEPISPITTPYQSEVGSVSPVYCETDIFQFPSDETRSENAETVEAEVDEHFDNSEDEYCCPEDIEDVYETMNPVNLPEASGEYASAYDHINVNAGYINTFPFKQPMNGIEDDYEYPQTSRSSSDNEYRYAYDWRNPGFSETTLSSTDPVQGYTPLDKDEADDNFYVNYQTLSRESLEKENEAVPLEYVTIL